MSFRAFINGKEGDVVKIGKATEVVLQGMILDDDGSTHDLSTATVDLVVYSRSDRNVTATATHSAAIVDATNGRITVTIAEAASIYGPGRYYGFIRRTLAADITWANKYTIIDII